MSQQQYGYEFGNPFGDPNKFTRGTQEDEVDRYNQWMRSQPWWNQARAGNQGDWTDQQKQALENSLRANGIVLPSDFHIDEGGNFNQKSRVKRNIGIGLAVGGAALGGLGLAGLGPLGGLGGAAGAGSGAAAGGSSVLSTTVPTIAGSNLAGGTITGAGLSALGGGGGGVGNVLGGIGKFMGGRTGQALGAGLAGIARAGAQNRGAELNAQLTREQLDLNRAAENRAERGDVWKKIQQSQYLQNRTPYQARPGLPTFGTTRGATTDVERQGAQAMEQELLRRLLNGSSLPPPTDVSRYTKPGVFERIAGYTAPVIGAYGGRK